MNEDDARRQKPSPGFTPIGDVLSGFLSPEMKALVEAAAVEAEPTTPTAKQGTKKPRQPSVKLAKAAAEIAARPSQAEAAYLARELVQCTLPHRDPGDVTVWVRRNGDYALGLQPGADLQTGKSIGLPYGPLPRLLLLWIVTEAVRTKDRRIKLGATLNEFLREIGLDPSTGRGKRGDATRLKEQMMRLFRCRISFEYLQSSGRHSWLDMQVAPKAEMWWDYQNPNQSGIFESHIILGEDFFKAITTAPVPLDMRALMPLKKSPLAIDLYTWATYRVFKLEQSKQREVSIPLASLKEQFGGEYTRLRDFKAALVDALAKVQQVYPALDYAFEKSALVLRAGRRAVPSRDRAERKTLAQSQARQMAEEMSQTISARGRAWFEKHAPGYSFETAAGDFYHWRDEVRHIKSENADAHFIDFVKNHWQK